MSSVSGFLGIVVEIYFLDTGQHSAPHFHATYGEDSAVYSIPDAEIVVGDLPSRKDRAVRVWADLRRDDLVREWENAVNGRPVPKIEPLR